ncbi:uncharacterized protein JCM6883_006742 [Sporobolomyces salmoneus]|uniref:uncharacterized protein n=1 Tax=Sporobolomyces salmoneus TaxID=183962 RepID=UPI00317D4182
MSTDTSSGKTRSIWERLPNEAHSAHSHPSSLSPSPAASSPRLHQHQQLHSSTTTTGVNQASREYAQQFDQTSSSSLTGSDSLNVGTRLSPSPRVPSIAFEPSSFDRSSPSAAVHSPRATQTRIGGESATAVPNQNQNQSRSASFSASASGGYDTSSYRSNFAQALAANSSSTPFSPPSSSSTTLNQSNPSSSPNPNSNSTQPLLAEIFSGRPRPHFRSSTSYSHASSSNASTSDSHPHSNPPPDSSSPHEAAPPSYFAAPTHRPQINRARSQSSAPSFDHHHQQRLTTTTNRDVSPTIGMNSNSHSLYGAPGSGLSQSFATTTTTSTMGADQHGWRPSHSSGGVHSHFSASLPTTSAVGSPTFSSFTQQQQQQHGTTARDLSPSSPSSRGAGYSPFARPSSSLASGPPPSSGAKPGAFLSQSFSTGWEDFEREREGRTRVRDSWLVDSASSGNGGLSPFSRGGGDGSSETTSSGELPQIMSSSSVGTGDSTWGLPTTGTGTGAGLGPGGVYKVRRDHTLGAVGSGRKRSDSAWGGTRERVLREQDEDDQEGGGDSFAPPTKSGATSRRHSFAAFEAPFGIGGSRGGGGGGTTSSSSQTVGFHLPEEVTKQVGGFSTVSTTGGVSNGLRMGGMGSSAIDDDDLAADLNSLHLSLDAHAKEQLQQERRQTTSTTNNTLHVGSMPVDFPPARSRRFDTSRSPPKDSALPSTSPVPPVSSHGLPTLPGSPRATAEPFTPSLVASHPPPPPASQRSTSSSVASRFFQQAPSPLPPTTTNAVATATPGGGNPSRFDFFGMPGMQQQPPPPVPSHHFQPQQRFGLPPPNSNQSQGFYNPLQNRGPPPNFHRQGPPPALGSTFSPFAPSPYQSPAMQHAPPPPPHMMNLPPHPPSGQPSYFAPNPPPVPSSQQSQRGGGGDASSSASAAAPLTSQSQSDMSLGRGVPLHAIPPDAPLCIVGFKAGRKDLFFCEDPSLTLEEGDLVIVEADRGRDVGKYLKRCSIEEVNKFQQHMVELALGQLANPASMTAMGFGPGNQPQGGRGEGGGGGGAGPAQLARMTKECQPKRIYAKAGPADTHALLAKAQDEVKALQLVRGKVAQKGLPMEILDAEWQWDRRKLTFYYTADQRVDFRELVRELFRIWKTRVWLCCLDQQQNGLDFN